MHPVDEKADDTGPRRRRGEELEDALLQATWEELVEHGYGALTIDAVAQRAGTSRTVVYRRWATKQELVEAAIVHVGRRGQMTAPDTGSVRGDVLAVLRHANRKRLGLTALMRVDQDAGDFFVFNEDLFVEALSPVV